MPETLTDAQKVLRNDTGKRIAVALEVIASGVEPSTVIAPEYDGSQTYAVGDLVIYRSVLYRCTTAITTPEEWTAAHWTATMVSDEYRPAAAQDAIDANLMALGLTGASVGDLVRVAAVDANGKPTSWNHVPLCEIKTNPNLLDNWYFLNAVNQRGRGSYPNPGYCIDRWSKGTGGAINSIGSTYGLLVTQRTAIIQAFESGLKRSLENKVCTLSVAITSGSALTVYYGTFSYQSVPSATISVFSNSNMKGEIGTDGKLYITWQASFNYGIAAAKLELGSEQTLAHQESGVWVLNEIPDYETELIKCKTSTADPTDIYANKTIGYNVSNRNLLDNWYFVGGGSQQGGGQFPINQRGLTIYTSANDSIDRWTSGSSITVNVKPSCIGFVGNGLNMEQPIEYGALKSIIGKQITGTVLYADNTIETGTGLWPVAPESSGWNYAVLFSGNKLDFVVGTSIDTNNNISGRVFLQGKQATEIEIVAVKLELGSEQTLAHQENGVWVLNEIPDYGQELAKCQRYFIRLGTIEWARYGLATALNDTSAAAIINLPVTMNKNIRCSYSGDIRLGGIQISNISQYPQWSPNNVTLDITATGLASGAVYALRNYNDATAHIDLYVE